jgi:DNA topoisomerase-1
MMDPLTLQVLARYQSKKKIKTESGEMTVYEYSDRQIANRNKAKAKKVEKLKSSIHDLRAKVKKDLKSSDPEKMLTALAVALMDHTYERVGNDSSAKDGHFGVTGWQKKHITFGKKVKIKYVGKSGVEHDKEITDATIKKALRDAYEGVEDDDANILSWEGGKVTAEKVNAYLKDFDVTAKDIRGYHANSETLKRLKEERSKGGKLPEDKKAREKQLKKEFLAAVEGAAEAVGHEASTLRSQYLVPDLEEHYIENGKIPDSFDKIGMLGLSLVERVVQAYVGYEVG